MFWMMPCSGEMHASFFFLYNKGKCGEVCMVAMRAELRRGFSFFLSFKNVVMLIMLGSESLGDWFRGFNNVVVTFIVTSFAAASLAQKSWRTLGVPSWPFLRAGRPRCS